MVKLWNPLKQGRLGDAELIPLGQTEFARETNICFAKLSCEKLAIVAYNLRLE